MKIPVLLLIPVAALFSQNRSDYGSLKITSDPAGHTVYCNGRDVGRTPVVVDSVAAGRCLVQIQDPRFESWWVEARIEPDTANLIHAILVPVTGSMRISADTDSLDIFLDKEYVGTGLDSIPKIPLGKHSLIVRTARGVQSREVLFEVTGKQVFKFNFRMQETWAQVSGVPDGAKVLFNRSIVCTTPTPCILLKPGRNKVVIALKGYRTDSRDLDLIASDTLRLSYQLKPVSRMDVVLRSLVFPGRGQLLLGDRLWGGIFSGTEAGLIASSVIWNGRMNRDNQEYGRSRRHYLNAIAGPDIEKWRSRMESDYRMIEKHEDYRNVSIACAAGVWVMNLIHAARHPDILNRSGVSGGLGLGPVTGGCSAGILVRVDL